MEERIAHLTNNLYLGPRAPGGLLEEVQRKLRIVFPQEYVCFVTESNGAEGFIGNSYLALWPLEEIILLNEAAEVSKFAPGLLLFGSDGGDTAYAFDTRSDAMTIVELPFIGMGLEATKPCGDTFTEFLEYLYYKD